MLIESIHSCRGLCWRFAYNLQLLSAYTKEIWHMVRLDSLEIWPLYVSGALAKVK